jgi:transcriptional regulator with XRE-family HTH domain
MDHIVRKAADLPADHWLRALVGAEESLQEYAEERAMLEVTGVLVQIIRESGLSQKDVAAALGTSPAFISQALGGGRNLTLRTIAGILWACGRQLDHLETGILGSERMRHPSDPDQYQFSISVQSNDEYEPIQAAVSCL